MSDKIRSCAISFLARREHSQLELEQKLIRKGFASKDIAPILEKIADQGLQSDERFADSYVNMRYNRGFGPIKIRMELKERGIDQKIINRYIDEDHQIWLESVLRVLKKKFGTQKPNSFEQYIKMVRYLTNKGFNNDQIKKLEL